MYQMLTFRRATASLLERLAAMSQKSVTSFSDGDLLADISEEAQFSNMAEVCREVITS